VYIGRADKELRVCMTNEFACTAVVNRNNVVHDQSLYKPACMNELVTI